MFNKLGFTFKGASLTLMLLNMALSITQIIATNWCSSHGKYYGYYEINTQLHSCAWELPGRDIFRILFIITAITGIMAMIQDWVEVETNWSNFKRVNISRILFVLSLLSVNALLEAVAMVEDHRYTGGYERIFYESFWYAMPISLIVLGVSAFTIINKIELYFTLPNRKR